MTSTDLKTLEDLCRLISATRVAEKAIDEQTGQTFELFLSKKEWENLSPAMRYKLLHNKELANGMSRVFRGLRAELAKEMRGIEERMEGRNDRQEVSDRRI